MTQSRILEDYRLIYANSDNSETIQLVKAYSVYYSWNNESFTITLL